MRDLGLEGVIEGVVERVTVQFGLLGVAVLQYDTVLQVALLADDEAIED